MKKLPKTVKSGHVVLDVTTGKGALWNWFGRRFARQVDKKIPVTIKGFITSAQGADSVSREFIIEPTSVTLHKVKS